MLRAKIQEMYSTFTPSQRNVADYFLKNYDSCAFLTLDDIALRIGVSTTTVIRFARTMGYRGYSELQRDIQDSVMSKVSLPERFVQIPKNTPHNQMLRETAENDIMNINRTLEMVSDEALEKAVKMLSGARNVYVLGMRSSFSLAYYAASRLGQIRPRIRLIESVGMVFPEELTETGPEDVCLAFTFPRYSRTTSSLLNLMKESGIKIILMTTPEKEGIVKIGDVTLFCSIQGDSFKNSLSGPSCLVNYLVKAVADQEPERAMETLEKTEDILRKGYYI